MANSKVLVRDIVFWTGLAFTAFSVAIPDARYLIYLLPFLTSLAVIADRATRFGDEAKPFVVLILAGLLFLPLSNYEGSKDLYFIITGISAAFLLNLPKISLWKIFILMFICTTIYFAFFGNFSAGVLIDVQRSYSSFEGKFGFLFALLCPFALLEKRHKLFLLCLLMAFLSLKRIALVAVIITSVMVLIGERRSKWLLNPPIMVLFNLLILSSILLYAYGLFDDLILSVSGQSANQLGQGRRELLTLPATEIILNPARFILFGEGPGSSYAAANAGGSVAVYGNTSNMHSDVVKIFYEYGLFLFMTFVWMMYSAKSFQTRIGFLFLNIIFITDNTLIYSFMLFIFVCCVRHPIESFNVPKTQTYYHYKI